MAACRAMFLCVSLCIVLAGASIAAAVGLPEPLNFICPHLSNGHYWIDVVGTRDGVPDPQGLFTVVARDIANLPMAGVAIKVIIDCPDIRIAATSSSAGQTDDCGPPQSATAITDAQGIATFTICGAGTNGGASPGGCGLTGASIYCDTGPEQGGWLLVCQSAVTVLDQNGASRNPGLEVTDLAALIADLGKAGVIGYKGRSDYNHNGTLDIVDLSLLLKYIGAGRSLQAPPGGYCP